MRAFWHNSINEKCKESYLIRFVFKRLLAAIPLLFVLSIVSFGLIRSLPGDPVDAMMGGNTRDIDPRELAAIRSEFGLDQPLPKQYASWLKGFLGHGELGRSYQDNRKVMVVIGERIPATMTLVGLALVLSFTNGVFWGLMMILVRFKFKNALIEAPMLATALLLHSIPAFFIGLLFIYLVTVIPALHFIPLFGPLAGNETATPAALLKFAVLPALTLAVNRSAKIALFVRSLALDEITRGYVTTALAKGLSYSQVIFRHVLRNCMVPIISLLALSLPTLIGGSVLVETIFAWPGTGRLAVEATFGRNFPVMTTLVMIYGTMVVLSNLIADIVQGFADPRIAQTIADSSDKMNGARSV